MNSTNEKLLHSAKELLKNGWSPGDIYKWIKEKASSEEDRVWISSRVFSQVQNTDKPHDQASLIHKRRVIDASYLKQELESTFGNLTTVGIAFIILGSILLVLSFILNGNNYNQSLYSLAAGIGTLIYIKLADFHLLKTAALLILGLIVFLIIEFVILGLPNVLIPNLGRFGDKQMVNVITIINAIFPWIYYAIKIGFIVIPVKYYVQRRKWEDLPEKIRREIKNG